MGMTKQGPFERTYHHIDAPTKQDIVFWARTHKRKLTLRTFRNDLLNYLKDTTWTFKRKLNGENIRVYWDGEQALWNGKTDKFQCSPEFSKYMNETFLEELFEEYFGRDKYVYLFGEHMGPKSQGNELGLDKSEFVLYDVFTGNSWLGKKEIISIARIFGIRSCYDFMNFEKEEEEGTLCELVDKVARGDFSNYEGIVATPKVECRYENGDRVIVKIKNKDYNIDFD